MNRQHRTAPARDQAAQLAKALGDHKAGRLDAAERMYRQILARSPNHADALHLLGLIAHDRGQLAHAHELVSRGATLRPGYGEIRNSLGKTLKSLGRRAEALAAFEDALRLDPENANAATNLGALLVEMGRAGEAIAPLQRAVALQPESACAHNNLGLVLREAGRLDEAQSALRRAIELQPDFVHAFNNLGVILLETGRAQEAAGAFRRALELAPGFANAFNNLASALKEAGHAQEALALYDQAAALQAPGFNNPWVGKAMLLIELGRAAEAEAAARQAIAINPASGAAWQVRSELKKFAPGDPDLVAMEAALSMARARAASSADRIDLEFALGKAWMDAGDAARAFAHFDEGNRHKRAKTPYDAAATSGCLNAVPTIFDDAFLRRLRGAGDPSEMPIFVIGMPRSGTSLIEQILASHSQVHGAGESAAIGQIAASLAGAATGAAYPEGLRGLQPENLMRMGREYVARVAPLAQGKRHVVDKMPTNFQYAGLIHLMLPNARIVHCRRNPVDTCLSCYTRNLRGRLGFCFDQRELGALYRDYERLMAHWRAVLPPERFIEVEYEEVVADLEGQARRLLEFCGLTWEPACLSFHATERRVQTASMNQVRQPAYRSSIGRWRAYAAHLGPLLEALGMAPEQRQRQAIAQA